MKKFDVYYYGAFMFFLTANDLDQAKEYVHLNLQNLVENSINYSRVFVHEL